MRAVVVIPTYNEKDNLQRLVEGIWRAVPDLHILVVDDNSPDGTGAIADELSRTSSDRLYVLHRARKAGLGRAYVAGFRQAMARGFDVILQMDADLSHDPTYLPSLLAAIETADVVLGSRYLHGVNVVNWDFNRLLLSKLAGIYVRAITTLPVSDPTGGFKCWRRRVLQSIDLDRLFSNGYLFQVEMTYRAFRLNYTVTEIPIIFYERQCGGSKMTSRIISEALWGVIRLRWSSLWEIPARGDTTEPVPSSLSSIRRALLAPFLIYKDR